MDEINPLKTVETRMALGVQLISQKKLLPVGRVSSLFFLNLIMDRSKVNNLYINFTNKFSLSLLPHPIEIIYYSILDSHLDHTLR
jgi:hypothetical protein